MNDEHPLLEASGVTKVFRRRQAEPLTVLRNIDLEVWPGDSIAIVGKSGAGKSTLLHLLGTLESPSGGRIRYNGQDVFAFSESRISKFRNVQLGFVFQFHYLMLEFTALENVMMPALIHGDPRASTRARAESLLEKVGLIDRRFHRPNQLSGGEQQRVAVARALMMGPRLLLTDEMTGNLDPLTGQQVFDLVHRVHSESKMAIISVTHDELLARSYRRVFRLVDGELMSA